MITKEQRKELLTLIVAYSDAQGAYQAVATEKARIAMLIDSMDAAANLYEFIKSITEK